MTNPLGPEVERERLFLQRFVTEISDARASASTPAVSRALELAGAYLFLALTYLGHTDSLFPDETSGTRLSTPLDPPTHP